MKSITHKGNITLYTSPLLCNHLT